MANSIGWGYGADNNQIGWGQGAINAIGWGSEYLVSNAGQTDIYPSNYVSATAFQTRVSGDSGTFESLSCLIQTINSI